MPLDMLAINSEMITVHDIIVSKANLPAKLPAIPLSLWAGSVITSQSDIYQLGHVAQVA